MFKRVYVEITSICNLNCSFCCSHTRNKEYMLPEKFEVILNKIKPLTSEIYLHVMGEPLLHPQLSELLDLAKEKDINVKITTNARMLAQKKDMLISKPSLKQINISLHSFCDGKVEENAIKELIPVIKEIANAKKVVVLRYWTGKNIDKKLQKIITDAFGNYNIDNKNNVLLDNYVYLSLDEQFDWPALDKPERQTEKSYCYGLNSHIGILVDGTVVPCCLDSNGVINLGNIFKQDISEILNSSRVTQMKKDFACGTITEELCKKCGYRAMHFKR